MKLQKVFGSTSLRHNGEVRAMAVAPDDSVVVAVDKGSAAIAWDLTTGVARWTFHAKRGSFTAVAFSTDGSRIALAGFDNRSVVLDARTGAELFSFETDAAAFALAFSPDGAWLLVGDNRKLPLFSLVEGVEHRALKGHKNTIHAVAFSPDGRYAASGGTDYQTKVHDVAKAKVLGSTEGGSAGALAFVDPEQRLHKTAGQTSVELPKGQSIRLLNVQEYDSGGLSGDRKRMAKTSGKLDEPRRVTVLEVGTGAKLFERAFPRSVRVALTYTGDRVIVASMTLEIWSVDKGELLMPRDEGHRGSIHAIASCKRTRRAVVVTASEDRTIKQWDPTSGAELETLEGAPLGIAALAVSPDGRHAVTASEVRRDPTPPQRWDLHELRTSGALAIGKLGTARALAVSPDGAFVAAGFSEHAALFDVETGALRLTIEAHKRRSVDAIAFSLDGKHVLTGGNDNLVKVWSLAGKHLHTIEGHTAFVSSLAPLPDGTCISASKELIRFDIATGATVGVSAEPAARSGRTLAASPDGAWLVAIPHREQNVELWSLTTKGLKAPAQTLTLTEEPTTATFLDATSLVIATRRGVLLRMTLTD